MTTQIIGIAVIILGLFSVIRPARQEVKQVHDHR